MVAALYSESESPSAELPSRWLRLGAAIIDLILVGIVFGVLESIVQALMITMKLEINSLELMLVLNFILNILFGLGAYLILNAYLLEKNGQTIGKMVCKIKIVGYDDRQIRPLAHILGLRVFPMMLIEQIPVIGPIAGIINVLMIFNQEKRCLHDFIAGTIVVKA
ncbi:RDD family protein [Blastopirellula sp. JC732]|uniref:RDD family protein n=1 Tax=Blastopirellula sediminis TaxID=2894196 RepID=A0A9X1MSS6_9BACT|nr:RDD family protein [Blastopirellula sediminis]MCC9631929.1 RDD family protein [Blastopirellula sediminis]